MAIEVNWGRLARAVEFYKARGYTYVEVPWTTDTLYAYITCRLPGHVTRNLPGKRSDVLVGSSEVSFLAMRLEDRLPAGKYVALTPCFRNEDTIDFLHQEYFMKVELYRDDVCNTIIMDDMCLDAWDFFKTEISPFYPVAWAKTEEGWDQELAGVEIGSYGIRRSLSYNHSWIYATGLAEPRFSRALSLLEEKRRVACG